MKDIFRRSLLKAAGALPTLRTLVASSGQHSLKSIGVQLYSVRDVIANNDPAEVLKSIEKTGYREVEVVWASLAKIWPSLQGTKLKPVSIHMDSTFFQAGNRDKLKAAINAVQQRKFAYMVYPAVPRPERTAGLDHFKALADTLNEAGTQCHKVGVQLCFHNHAYEFHPIGSSSPWEVLTTQTDPRLINFELDIFWASVAEHDPAEMLKRYSGRFPLMHLKNKLDGVPVQFNEDVPHEAFKEVGDGVLNIPAILRTASDTGVKHFFVEQDWTPGNPVDSLRKSYDYRKHHMNPSGQSAKPRRILDA